MLQLVSGPFAHIFALCLSQIRLCEVQKAMIEEFAGHNLRTLYFLTYPKWDLCEVEKAMLQVIAEAFAQIIAFWLSKNNTLARLRKP